MQNQCYLNVRSKCILNALRIRKGKLSTSEVISQKPKGEVGKHPPPPVPLGLNFDL